jgi:DNA-binding transcriptional LysR family regulator
MQAKWRGSALDEIAENRGVAILKCMNRVEPSWDLYRTFLAVLTEHSLSGAARALGLTQPTVARHIDALEAAIGYDLFVRSQHGLAPTDAGLELKPYAETLASTSAALLRAASGHGAAVSGTVRISASEVVGVEVLPAILTDLRGRHPELVIELVLSNNLDDLLRREADIAVRMVEPVHEALVARLIGSITLGLHANRLYLDQRGAPSTLEDLSRHDLIGFDRGTPAIRSMLKRVSGFGRIHFALKADSDLAQLAAIRAGFGIGVCQVPLAARSPELVRVLAEEFRLDLQTWVVMHEDLRSSPRCRAVFDALVDGLTTYTRAAQPLP